VTASSLARTRRRGVIVDARGEPVLGAFVTVHADADGIARGSGLATDVEGRFVVREVAYGTQVISAQAPDQVHWQLDASAPGTAVEVKPAGQPELRLTLPGLVKPVRGRVLRGGLPVAGAIVVAQILDSSELAPMWVRPMHWGYQFEHMTRSDGDGSFVLPRTFDASHYHVAAYLPGGGASAPLRVVGGAEVVLDVPVTGAIAGTITGAPQSFGVRLARQGSDDIFARELRHTGGRWGFEGAPAGTYQVTAVAENGCTTSALTLAAGERREDVALALGSAGGVRGQLLDGDTHEPMHGVDVSAVHTDPDIAALAQRGATTDADGRFELRGLCPGKHDLGARVEDHVAQAPATIEAGRFTEVTLRMR
jgi:hypothetical protein